MKKLILLLLASFAFACGSPTGPNEGAPRVFAVEAASCQLPQGTFESCLRVANGFDPALRIPESRLIYVQAVYQNPPLAPDSIWEVYTVYIDGNMQTAQEYNIPGPYDERTKTVRGHRVWLGIVPHNHPEVVLEITLVTGTDRRFVRPVADTTFVWPEVDDTKDQGNIAIFPDKVN